MRPMCSSKSSLFRCFLCALLAVFPLLSIADECSDNCQADANAGDWACGISLLTSQGECVVTYGSDVLVAAAEKVAAYEICENTHQADLEVCGNTHTYDQEVCAIDRDACLETAISQLQIDGCHATYMACNFNANAKKTLCEQNASTKQDLCQDNADTDYNLKVQLASIARTTCLQNASNEYTACAANVNSEYLACIANCGGQGE